MAIKSKLSKRRRPSRKKAKTPVAEVNGTESQSDSPDLHQHTAPVQSSQETASRTKRTAYTRFQSFVDHIIWEVLCPCPGPYRLSDPRTVPGWKPRAKQSEQSATTEVSYCRCTWNINMLPISLSLCVCTCMCVCGFEV